MEAMRQAVLDYIDAHESEMLEFWRGLVKIESPSHFKPGVDAVGQCLAEFCRDVLGYHIRLQADETYGACLAACSCPFEQYEHGIALSAHMDTVHPLGSFDPVLREDEEYLYGPGAGDCKGGIVLCLLTAAALKHAGYQDRPIKLLFAADEESGGPTGKVFYPRELVGSDYMFNAESGLRDVLVTGRKASLIATYDITGVSCHIGYLQGKPISAIREATMKMLALENASDYENLTFCCGRIDGGAGATSVPEHCRMQVNVRIRDLESVDSVMQLLQQQAETTYVPGTHTTLSVQGVLFPMEDREENRALCRRFSEISQSLGFGSYSPRFVGGASDAAHAAAMKIPVICASGPVVDFQHTLRERVLKASMAQRAKVHALTILELSK